MKGHSDMRSSSFTESCGNSTVIRIKAANLGGWGEIWVGWTEKVNIGNYLLNIFSNC